MINFAEADLQINVGSGFVSVGGTVDNHGDGDASTYDYDLTTSERNAISKGKTKRLKIFKKNFTDPAENQ